MVFALYWESQTFNIYNFILSEFIHKNPQRRGQKIEMCHFALC